MAEGSANCAAINLIFSAMLSADPRRRGRGRGRDIIDEAGPSTDTGTRPRRLTRAPNDGASESESDSDLSDAEVDDELHSNGDASEDEEEDAALAAAFAEAAGALRPIQSK